MDARADSRAVPQINEQQQGELATALEDEVDARCKQWTISHSAGPMFWLRCLTKTENHQWKEQGREPVAPFPYKPFPPGTLIDLKALPFPHDFTPDDPPDYLDVTMDYLLTTKDINVPKTREMMTLASR